MAVKLAQITHGSTGWDQVANDNFSKLNQDTGWIKLTLVSPAGADANDTSTPTSVRMVNGVVQYRGTVMIQSTTASETNGTKIADVPTQFLPTYGWLYGSVMFINKTGGIHYHINESGIYIRENVLESDLIDLGSINYVL